MGAGDHHPAVGGEMARCEVEHRRGAEADAINDRSGSLQSLNESRLKRGRAEPAVVTDGYRMPTAANDKRAEGAADAEHVLQPQRFAHNAADVAYSRRMVGSSIGVASKNWLVERYRRMNSWSSNGSVMESSCRHLCRVIYVAKIADDGRPHQSLKAREIQGAEIVPFG